ncbi:MAG: hypothetical protein KA982_04470 [Clostridia bacterium]|nr:hypothetical protein [Clostridia bacterium]
MRKRITSMITVISLALCGSLGTYPHNANASAKEAFEDISKRSECTKVFDNDNGTYTAYSNTAPIHYLNNDEWKEIDNTLIEDSDDYYRNKDNSFNIYIPKEYSLGKNIKNPVIMNYDTFSLSTSITDIKMPDRPEEETFSEGVYADINNEVYTTIDNSAIAEGMKAALKKSASMATYHSIVEDIDLDIAVHNASVSESIIINKLESLPETITYSISVEDAIIKKTEDNRLQLIKDNEAVLILSPFTINDSSENVNVMQVEYDLTESEEGYEVTLYPAETVNRMSSPVMPLSLGSEHSYDRPYSTVYNSQASPTSVYNNNYIKVGNESNNSYHTIGSFLEDFSFYGPHVRIVDSTFYYYVTSLSTFNNPQPKIIAYSNNEALSTPNWNNTTPINSNYTVVNSESAEAGIPAPSVVTTGWNEVNLTVLTQACLNYKNTNSTVGLANNGFTLCLESDSGSATATAYSENASSNQPIFTVTFSVNNQYYTLEYAPLKYNNIVNNPGSIYNFQSRMNCYAYALQIYYSGDLSLTSNNAYYLKPGEFGISENTPSVQYCLDTGKTTYTYTFANYYALNNKYSDLIEAAITTAGINAYAEFIEEQMYKDAQAMGVNLRKFTIGSSFSLPNDYNPSSERIIAMMAYQRQGFPADYHFYLRNGNGSCTNQSHSSNCSKWTHKVGNTNVKDTSHSPAGYELCDQNIKAYANFFTSPYNQYSTSNVNYYCISKKPNIYAAYHDFGQYYNSTGTQFHIN